MKTTTLLALATGLGQASATFRFAPPFSCPDNTIEVCVDKQQNGFDWSDLADGVFEKYGGFDFSGFECKSGSFGKRDSLSGRTFGSKAAWGVAERRSGSSFGCGSSREIDQFSIAQFDISTEFDVDLEFLYDMADGSKCRQRSKCSKKGTTIRNRQCGGAKKVTIVYPDQEIKRPKCNFGIHSMSFSCGTPTGTTLIPTTSTSVATSDVEPTTTTTAEETTETEITTTGLEVTQTSSTAVETEETTSTRVEETSTTTTEAEETKTTSTEAEETTSSMVTSTLITSYMTTKTVFETSVATVTSCSADVVTCPDDDNTVVLTTHTVAVSTTICPVTETLTTEVDTSEPPKPTSDSSPDQPETTIKDPETTAEEPETTIEEPQTTTKKVDTTTEPQEPLETIECPVVVPSCLNTWLFTVGCKSNTDRSCYCPDASFVEKVFSCIYAYGDNDDIIQEAVEYFQGICADHAPENPAIATGAESVTKVITPKPTPGPSQPYTTVEVVKTTIVPCEEDGTTKSDSSTTVVVSTQMNVPYVSFITKTDEAENTSAVVLVPGTNVPDAPEPIQTPDTTLYTKSMTTKAPVPTGTGVLPAPSSSGTPVPVTAAAAPREVALGAIAVGVVGAIAAL